MPDLRHNKGQTFVTPRFRAVTGIMHQIQKSQQTMPQGFSAFPCPAEVHSPGSLPEGRSVAREASKLGPLYSTANERRAPCLLVATPRHMEHSLLCCSTAGQVLHCTLSAHTACFSPCFQSNATVPGDLLLLSYLLFHSQVCLLCNVLLALRDRLAASLVFVALVE